MGFMDKAKQLAEQARQKLDETQKQRGQAQGEARPSDASRHAEHGRPIEERPPAGTAPPPSAEPVEAGDAPDHAPDPFKQVE